MSRLKSFAKVVQLAILSARPVVNDIKKIHAALAAGTPTEIKIGRTIEPTMMMDPKPESVVKRTATAIDIIKVITRAYRHQALHFS